MKNPYRIVHLILISVVASSVAEARLTIIESVVTSVDPVTRAAIPIRPRPGAKAIEIKKVHFCEKINGISTVEARVPCVKLFEKNSAAEGEQYVASIIGSDIHLPLTYEYENAVLYRLLESMVSSTSDYKLLEAPRGIGFDRDIILPDGRQTSFTSLINLYTLKIGHNFASKSD